MRYDPNLTEKLIDAVREKPLLYDVNLPDYKNTCLKKIVWQEISDELGGKNGESMCWKWKQLRDSYRKYNKTKDEYKDDKYKQWRWAPKMESLDDFLRKPRNIIDEPDDSEPENTRKSCVVVSAEENRSSSLVVTAIKTNPSEKRKYVELPDETYSYHETSERLDSTDYLFLSYAETFKKLSPRRQAILKFKIAEIFAKAELKQIDTENDRNYEPTD